ncbi:MAG: WYL domain-containing protein [Clostridia bacterium]|nr:WYL domain-containing protein [Clostridia bacterium]
MNDNRTRLLRIEQLLNTLTDGDHPLNANQLVEMLYDKYNIETERKAIYRDVTGLTDAGIEIERTPDGFARIERTFELQELKLIVDAVLSSKFLPEKDTHVLLDKIKTLCSVHEAQELQRQMVVSNRVKNMNTKVFYSLDVLNRAINENKQVSFSYFSYNADKQVEMRNRGKEYIRSPFMLLYEDDCYYCLMYDQRMKKVIPYRVDRMKYAKVIEDSERDGIDVFAAMDKRMYTQFTFGMFGGEVKRVSMRCNVKLMNVFIDKFGKEVWTNRVDKDHFTATVPVAVSPQFFGWVCGLGEQVEITAPEDVKNEFVRYIENIASMYKKAED